MKKFIVRRVLLGAMILFFVSMIIYSIERALPTSYVEGRARDMSMKQGAKPYDELVAELNASSACNQEIFQRNLVFFCTGAGVVPVGNHNRHTFGYYIGDQTVQQGRLCGDSICTNRYFAAILLLCHHSEMDFLHQSEMAGPVRHCRPYA